MNVIHTNFSTWQAARIAASKIQKAIESDRAFDWLGIDSTGAIVLGSGQETADVCVVATEAALRTFDADSGLFDVDPADCSRGTIDAIALLVQRFERVAAAIGDDPGLYEPTLLEAFCVIASEAKNVPVRFATPTPRDRVDAHIARSCEHCRPAFEADPWPRCSTTGSNTGRTDGGRRA